MNITLRKADKNDLGAIQALHLSLESSRVDQYDISNRAFHKKTKPPSALPQAEIKTDMLIVAVVDETIVGYVRGSFDKRPHHSLKKWAISTSFSLLKTIGRKE
jgi:hypothetical protein